MIFSARYYIIIVMKKFLMPIIILPLLVSCISTGIAESVERIEKTETIYIEDMDDIMTSISVDGRLCTLKLSAVTGEKFLMVADGRRFRTYQLTELPVEPDGTRRLYSTAGNINLILRGNHIYISIETKWTETYIDGNYLSPFIFDTHA